MDAETIKALKGLLDEVERLQHELDAARSEVWSLKEYIHYRDGIQFDEFYSRLRDGFLNYSVIRNSLVRQQLADDNLMMLRKRAEDDFFEYCRYAFLQIETVMKEYVGEIELSNRPMLEALWQQQQQRRTGRQKSHSMSARPPRSIVKMEAGDLLELCFLMVYDTDFSVDLGRGPDGSRQYTPCQELYWTLVNAKQLRNIISHRDANTSKMARLASNSVLKDFYMERHKFNNYHQVVEGMRTFFRALHQYAAGLRQSPSTPASQKAVSTVAPSSADASSPNADETMPESTIGPEPDVPGEETGDGSENESVDGDATADTSEDVKGNASEV